MQFVKNEWMKLWSQKSTWIMLFIMLAILGLITGLNKYFETAQGTAEERRVENEEQLKHYSDLLASEDFSEEEKANFADQVKLIEYRIEHDMKSEDAMTFNAHMDFSLQLTLMFISVFTVVVAAGIVSSEFNTGTIKMLLTRPVARWKILLSKLVTVILYGVSLYVVSVAFSALLGFILWGTDTSVTLSIVDGVVVEESNTSLYFETLLYNAASIFITILFAFMIGSLFGSSTLAVGLSLFILLMGTTITMFLAKYEFAKYIWFANDLTQFTTGSVQIIEGITLPFSITVNAVYSIIFLVVTFLYFTKRDVTA